MIGVPDDILGQAVKAFVVLEQGVVMTAQGHPARVPGAGSRTSWCRSTSRSSPTCRRRQPARSRRRTCSDRHPDRNRATAEGVDDHGGFSPPDDRRSSASSCCAAGRARAASGDRAARAHRHREAAGDRRDVRRGHRHVLRRGQPRLRDRGRAAARGLGERSDRRLRRSGAPQRRRSSASTERVDGLPGRPVRRPGRRLDLEGTIDVVVCNPPYISTGRLAGDRAALLEHEPREAFDGGPYGLEHPPARDRRCSAVSQDGRLAADGIRSRPASSGPDPLGTCPAIRRYRVRERWDGRPSAWWPLASRDNHASSATNPAQRARHEAPSRRLPFRSDERRTSVRVPA